jgi:glycoprotein-N-acetylgalactosamine 3-beta-galactosyltransferase
MLHRMGLEGKDSNGNPWPPSLASIDDLCEGIGVFGGRNDDNKKLLDAVPIAAHSLSTTNSEPTVFCGVYTMQEAHATNIRAMRETWAPQCNGFLAFSTHSDPRIPAIALPHDGPEEYNNMWQKIRSIWRFIGEHYLEDFDYFILGGEDLFIVPPNLRKYLQTLGSPELDHFAGRRFKGYGADNYFNSGGSGYVLSRGTLRKFFKTGLDHPHCNPKRHTPMEDVMTAACLRNVFSIGLTDTRDEQGRERFHPFSPGSHLTWTPPKYGKNDWYEDYNTEWGIKLGADCCAPDSVSFHYIKKPAMVRHLYSLLYHCKGRR